MNVKSWVLAVDIGGTWTRFAAVDEVGRMVARLRQPTGSESSAASIREGWSAAWSNLTATLLEKGVRVPPVAVGIGATGPVDRSTGRLTAPPNTGAGLDGLSLVEEFSAITERPVAVERDTNAALLAESRIGVGRNLSELVYLTVSTGVGGAAMSDGALMLGRNGGAVEVGHVIADPEGPRCGCGRSGCLEAIASGPAIAAHATVLAVDPDAVHLRAALERDGVLTGAAVARAAAAGDPVARAVLRAARMAVVSAVVDLANTFDPDLVILGGSVTTADERLAIDAQEAVRTQALPPTCDTTRVACSTLGDDGVLLGAATLARSLADRRR